MKKIAALLLALTMVISIEACGGNNETTTETTVTTETTATTDATTEGNTTTDGTTEAATTAATTSSTVTSTVSVEEAGNAVIAKVAELTENMMVPMGMMMEPGYLTGFNTEITGFAETFCFMPMIGTIPFVGYVFRVSDASQADAFVKTLEDNTNMRWNLCTSADTKVVSIHGDLVLYVLCNTENLGANCEADLKGAFEAAVK